MEILIKLLQLILSLSLLVFVHELGHYLTARMFGIKVDKFYLFFDAGGVSLLKFKIGETTFGLGWLPFGGYCKIAGMIDESMDTEAMKLPPQPWEFRSKPAWQRLIVMVGGVVMNLITACVIYIGMSWHWGDNYIDNADLEWGYAFNELAREMGFEDGDRIVSFDGEPVEGDASKIYPDMIIGSVRNVTVSRTGAGLVDIAIPEGMTSVMLESPGFMIPRFPFVISEVVPDGGAAAAGMMPGDSLVSFNGKPVMALLGAAYPPLVEAAGTTARVELMRDSVGVRVLRTLDVAISAEGQLGVFFENFIPMQTRKYGFGEGIGAGFRKTGAEVDSYWQQLKLIFTPKTEAYKQVGSLITIGSIFPGEWNWYGFWRITALLSIIFSVMNILPIPMLDGGHVVFLLWEVITRRKPGDKFLEVTQIVGMVLVFGIMILAFWNDIYRFFIK